MPSETQIVATNLSLHCFSSEVGQNRYLYEVIKLKDSLMIFINVKNRREFNDLSLAIKSRYDSLPISSRIMGDFSDETSKECAARISKKLGKSVFVSLNVPMDKYALPLIEKQLFIEIKSKPEMF